MELAIEGATLCLGPLMPQPLSMDVESHARGILPERKTELMARGALGLAVLGAILVGVAWQLWPEGEKLPFEITFSVGMLGVNAAWLLGVIVIVRECWLKKFSGWRGKVLWWAGLAIAVAEGVFW